MTGNGNGNGGSTAKTEGRSPSWPAIAIDEALEKVRLIYDSEKRHATNRDVIFQHWGYSVKSSNARQALAALRYFGLLDVSGENFKVSDTAWRIIVDPDQNSSTRQEFIRQLALKPKIHQEIWLRYGEELPSDQTFKSYLIFDKGFNQNGADDFIKQYKKTIEFAKLANSELEEIRNRDGFEDEEKFTPSPSIFAIKSEPVLENNDNAYDAIFKMTLSKGNILEIRMKKKISPSEYDSLFNEQFFKFVKFSLSEEE